MLAAALKSCSGQMQKTKEVTYWYGAKQRVQKNEIAYHHSEAWWWEHNAEGMLFFGRVRKAL